MNGIGLINAIGQSAVAGSLQTVRSAPELNERGRLQ